MRRFANLNTPHHRYHIPQSTQPHFKQRIPKKAEFFLIYPLHNTFVLVPALKSSEPNPIEGASSSSITHQDQCDVPILLKMQINCDNHSTAWALESTPSRRVKRETKTALSGRYNSLVIMGVSSLSPMLITIKKNIHKFTHNHYQALQTTK